MAVPFLRTAAAVALFFALILPLTSAQSLPIVDLGYEFQQATLFNSTGGFYNFSNIRYAAPPLGDLRFSAPQAPAVNRSTVQTGLPDRICAQANPAWLAIAGQYGKSSARKRDSTQANLFSSTQIYPRVPPGTDRVQRILLQHQLIRRRTATDRSSHYGRLLVLRRACATRHI